MRNFTCDCGQLMFYENSLCLECKKGTGFDPQSRSMLALEPAAGGLWVRQDTSWKFCSNLNACGCNWLIPAESESDVCLSCATTRVIPDQSLPLNPDRWHRLETAKRRLLYSLLDFKLWGPGSLLKPTLPLVFDFLEATPTQAVMTGHHNGVITINVAEADDDQRERLRHELYEPYRTLLGHMRHEVGHYYWDVLIAGTSHLDEYRKLFGDETADYNLALERHYQQGPPLTWKDAFVSAYATMHPWEDWAETWAHCLHMHDTLETADYAALSTRISGPRHDPSAFTGIAGSTPANAVDYAIRMERWVGIVMMANELSRSMGQPDVYPFALTVPVLQKLLFIERVIAAATAEATET